MSNIIPFDHKSTAVGFTLPDHLKDLFKSNTGGGDSIPKLSIRGKIWSVNKDDTETPYLDEEGNAIPSLKVIVLGQTTAPDGRPTRSRAWFAKVYDGSAQAPECNSYDGIKPSEDSTNPQSVTCASCEKNIKGTSANGKSTACGSGKRLAVIPSNDLEHEAFLLQLPITSLWSETETLADRGWYSWDGYMKFLKSHKVPHTAMVETSMRFLPTVEHPQIVFKYSGQLSAEGLTQVASRLDNEETRHILGSDRGYATRVGKLETEADEPQQFVAPKPTPKAADPLDDFDDDVKPTPKPKADAKPVAKPKPVVVDEDDFDDAPVVQAKVEKPKAAEKAVVVEDTNSLAAALADWD